MSEKKLRFEDVTKEDILNVPDAECQSLIAKIPDLVLYAGLKEAPCEVRVKILSNLSARKKEQLMESGLENASIPSRTRQIAWKVIVKKLFKIEGEEEKYFLTKTEKKPQVVTKKEYDLFIKKMVEDHPDFKTAKQVRHSVLISTALAKLFKESNRV